MNIKVKCSTGISLPLSEIEIYPNYLKKHSMLEIWRIVDSIKNNGILFPIAIGRLNDVNYVVDGEATYEALCELSNSGDTIPDIPVYYVRCKNEEELKKMILISTSVNHCVTESSLKNFVEGTELNLHDYGFSTSALIDFHTDVDLGLYVDTIGGKYNEAEVKEDDFEGMLFE